MDAPAPTVADLQRSTQSRRRGAHSIEIYFIFIICFAILSIVSIVKLDPLARNALQNSANIKIDLPQKNQLDSGSL